jgi:hypothetical protein
MLHSDLVQSDDIAHDRKTIVEFTAPDVELRWENTSMFVPPAASSSETDSSSSSSESSEEAVGQKRRRRGRVPVSVSRPRRGVPAPPVVDPDSSQSGDDLAEDEEEEDERDMDEKEERDEKDEAAGAEAAGIPAQVAFELDPNSVLFFFTFLV